jgi:hypothetical protein
MTSPQTPPPRSRHGCLFGCLGVLAVLLLPLVLVSAYSAWFFREGFHHSPVLQAVTELVRHDGTAGQVLGGDIHITGIEGDSMSFMTQWGSHSAYVVGLSGSKASGTLAVAADMAEGHLRVESMILMGPDGTRYDLMQHTITPPDHPNSNPTTAI